MQKVCVYVCVCALSCVWPFCDPQGCSLPGFSVHGILQAKNTGVVCSFLLQGNFPNLDVEPVSLASPALAGRFFTTVPIGGPIRRYYNWYQRGRNIFWKPAIEKHVCNHQEMECPHDFWCWGFPHGIKTRAVEEEHLFSIFLFFSEVLGQLPSLLRLTDTVVAWHRRYILVREIKSDGKPLHNSTVYNLFCHLFFGCIRESGSKFSKLFSLRETRRHCI